ncbi:MAG: PAS domain S-box protein, partial [Bacteroidales bacterium]|nr:PAS domain S-box protein [Bacteroidales bacterium]
ISDITERKRVEDALHSALQHLKFHESNSPLAVIEFDKDFRVTKWSKNAAKIFGWQEKEVLGKLMFEFKWVYEEDIEKVSFLSQQLLTTKNKSYKNVNRNYNKDGSVITCEWFNSALSDSEGNLISVQSLIQDITQRVNSEEKLRRSEKNLADAERISHSGSWVYDINSGNSEWSENMYNLFEIERSHPKELLFDIYLRTRVHPDDRIHLLRVFINARDGRGDFDLVYRNIKSDGRIRYIQAIAETLRDKGNNAFRMVGKVQDITEQKISNDFLKKSEEKFRKLFENSPLGKTITTVDGLVQVNSSFCWMIGYSSEELKNIDWTKIIHPDDIKKTNDEFQILISGSSDRVRNEKRYIHKDGSIIFTDVSTYLHRGSDGKPRYFIATIIDMTERVLLERERFRLLDIIDQSINEIYLFHSDTLRFDYANSGALNNLGYTIYEIRFLTPVDIKPQFSAESFIQLIEPLRSGEKGSLVFETVHRRKNGTEYPVEVHLQLFKREEQSLFLAIISDITERIINKQRITKLNEELELRVIDRTEKLRISQQNYREIFEISPVSILKEDWEKVIREIKRIRKEEGVSDFRSYFETNPLFVQSALDSVKILDINPATMTLFGASGKHQLLKSLRVVFSAPDLIPGFVDELVALSSGMTVFESDIALRKLDNEIIYVLVRMVFPPADSENGIVLVNIADITFRKKAQQALEESQQKLLLTNQELESFTYTVSHDLRAPLRAIDGFSKILTEDYMDKLDKGGERVIGVIRENTRKMGNLIDDLLSFSRLGKSQVNISMTNMQQVIESAFNDLIASRESDNIHFETGDIHNIVCDRTMILQVWTNLISNAIKFSSGKKKIKISISSHIENDFVIYCISDNGVGFDMKYYGKLFGVFERLHNANEFEGTGVGLAIVERIINKHGGKIWAEGKPGVGAIFCFSLPILEDVAGDQD